MRAPSINALSRFANPNSARWTCSNCRNQLLLRSNPAARSYRRQYSSGHSSGGNRRSPRNGRANATLWATATAAAGVGGLALTDNLNIAKGYEATERAGRVASALFICINDYRTTLKKRDTIEDEDQKNSVLSECHKRCSTRTFKVLEKNGGIFIKLGQHLSAMTYLLPVEWTDTFIPLQDRCPVSSFESIAKMFRDDTGEELEDYFSEFSKEPIGAASLAQVHLATIKETGQRVAVKVQHPTLAQWAPLDTLLTKFTFSTLKKWFPEYDLEWLASEMEVSLPQELDFQLEAVNAMKTKQHFANISGLPLVIPQVIWAKTRILVMANESGHRLDDLEYLDASGIDRDEVSATLARIFNEMIFGKNATLHCDPHGGNIAIRKTSRRGPGGANFEVILYDHGLYRDIPEVLRRNYARMWLAVIDGDMDRMKHYAHEVAGITDEQFPLFASAITGRDYSVISSSITKPRSTDEKKTMGDALQEGLLTDLVQLLGQVPRIMLLILKTNDLTRSLDENLQTRQGPMRNFMILARYCARTVLEEQMDEIREHNGSLLWPGNALRFLAAYVGFLRVELKLEMFEMWLSLKRIVGIQTNFGAAVL
ncbi:ankyrin [Apiospora arundinis]